MLREQLNNHGCVDIRVNCGTCGETIELRNVERHMNRCRRLNSLSNDANITCEICRRMISPGDYPDHLYAHKFERDRTTNRNSSMTEIMLPIEEFM